MQDLSVDLDHAPSQQHTADQCQLAEVARPDRSAPRDHRVDAMVEQLGQPPGDVG
jgi:hypothetical protein